AQKYMDEGHLVPDEVVIGMVDEKIKSTTDAKGFIFDGFPRTVAQAEAVAEPRAKNNMEMPGMSAAEVPEDILRESIRGRGKTSGRADDQDEEKINTRIKVYLDETLPVADFYKKQGKLSNIHGVGEIDEIFAKIVEVIDHYA